jgi:hypothetical protein
MVGDHRSAWRWSAGTVSAVSLTGIVVNIATDLKTSVLAWIAVIAATAAGSIAAWAGYTTDSARRIPQAASVAFVTMCIVALTLGIFALASTAGGAATTAAKPAEVSPRVIQDIPSRTLVSSSDFCPTEDKIDLDTARSGHGGQTQLGDYLDTCRVEGGLAELILEEEEIYTPPTTADCSSCRHPMMLLSATTSAATRFGRPGS